MHKKKHFLDPGFGVKIIQVRICKIKETGPLLEVKDVQDLALTAVELQGSCEKVKFFATTGKCNFSPIGNIYFEFFCFNFAFVLFMSIDH